MFLDTINLQQYLQLELLTQWHDGFSKQETTSVLQEFVHNQFISKWISLVSGLLAWLDRFKPLEKA